MRQFVILSAARDLLLPAMFVVAGEASAQKPVLLQLRPRIGDTVWMRLEQQMEITSRRTELKAAVPVVLSTTTVTFSRAAVESGVPTSTTVTAITDSQFVTNGDPTSKGSTIVNQKQMQGQRVRLQIAPDGSLNLPSDNSATTKAPAQRPTSLIPATFPLKPVAVGESWTREAPLPAGSSQLGAAIVGSVQATFRLDSLTRNGDLAWVSINGKLLTDPAGAKMDGATTVDDGTVEGYMVLDRARGWLTESRFSIVAHSTLRQPFGVAGQPMKYEIRLIQELRTLR